MAEKITIAELDINTDALIKQATATRTELSKLREEQKKLKKGGEENTEAFVKNEVAIKKLSTSYNEQKKVLTSLTDENKNFVQTEVAINKATTKNITTIEGARKSNKELLAIRNKLNLNTDEGRKQLVKINEKLDQNNKFIKENVSGYEQQKIGIGQYTSALDKFFPRLGSVVKRGEEFRNGLVAQKAALQASSTATTASAKALRIFKIALISTGVGALVVALGTLVTFLTSTQKGVDAVTKVTKPLEVVFSKMLGVVQDLGEDLFDAFSNPKQVLVDLMDFVKTNVLNRFKAFGVVLQGLKDFDLTAVGNGILQFGTGVEDVIGKVQKASEATSKFVSEAVADGLELRQIAIDIENSEANLVLSRQKNRDLIAEQELIAKNTANSATERNKAADEALRLSRELAEQEKNLINLKIQEEVLNQSLNDSGREDLKKLNELKAQSIAADTAQKKTELRFLTAKSAVEKENAAAEKKRKDEKEKERVASEAKELEQLTIFEQQKRDRKNEIDLANAESDKAKEVLKLEQDFEKQALDIENLTINEEQKTELLALLEEQRIARINELQQGYRDDKLKSDTALALKENDLRKKSFSTLVGFVGAETKLGKSLIIAKQLNAAKESLINLGILKNKAATNAAGATGDVAAGVASTAKVGFPQNIPLLIGFAAQIGGIVSSIKSASKATQVSSFHTGGVAGLSSGKINTASNIPTQRGGDNILATVKTGEVILNQEQQAKAGGSAFFSSIGVPGFNTGGVVGNTAISTAPIQAAGSSSDAMVKAFAQEVNKIKVVAIEQDITDAQSIQASIIDGASI